MGFLLNEYDIEDAVDFWDDPEYAPNMHRAAQILLALVHWTNSHSDGWPSWDAPSNASRKLQELVEQKRKDYREDGCRFRDGEMVRFVDPTDAEINKVLTPIKAFCTKAQKLTDWRDRSQPLMTTEARQRILNAGTEVSR